jgi:hypothetical protein
MPRASSAGPYRFQFDFGVPPPLVTASPTPSLPALSPPPSPAVDICASSTTQRCEPTTGRTFSITIGPVNVADTVKSAERGDTMKAEKEHGF